MRLQAAILPGGRLHLQDGPIDLVISAEGHGVGAAYRAAAARMETLLDELCGELPVLRSTAGVASGDVARAMQAAVAPFQAGCFITPMAAVAGAVADAVLHAMVRAGPLDRVIVNNGGDIAFYLVPSSHITAGLVDRPDRPALFATTRITAGDPVRGIATSGFGGRSDTFGIADAVTILAATAAQADAAATIVANAVDLPGHPAITRGPSRRAGSDLGRRAVTLAVGMLTADEIGQALAAGAMAAGRLRQDGLLHAAALHLRGQTWMVGPTNPPCPQHGRRGAPTPSRVCDGGRNPSSPPRHGPPARTPSWKPEPPMP